MNNSKPHSAVLTFHNKDLDHNKDLEHISTIKDAINLAKILKATADKTSDAYIVFEMSELISKLKEIQTEATRNIIRISEHKRAIADLKETQLDKCFDVHKDQINCSICSN